MIRRVCRFGVSAWGLYAWGLPAWGIPLFTARVAWAQDVTGALPPPDLSPTAMFLHADSVVKGVMIGLAFASVLSWTVLLAKTVELLAATRATRRALLVTTLGQGQGQGAMPRPLALMRDAVDAELSASSGTPAAGIKERLASRLRRIELTLARRAGRATGLLATIGSVAPFVGLFGTVWGIMNSFIGIARLHTSSLAVVAPGIAEALLATATGLAAAIPAVVIYNLLARWIGAYRASLAELAEGVLRDAARTLDRRLSPDGVPDHVRALAAAE